MITTYKAREAANWLVSFTSPLTEQGVKKVLEASTLLSAYIDQHAKHELENLELLRAKARCWDAIHDEDDCEQLEKGDCSLCESSEEAQAALHAMLSPVTTEST